MNALIIIVTVTILIVTQMLNAQEPALKFPTDKSRIEFSKNNVLLGLR